MYRVTCLYGGTTYVLHDPLTADLRVYDDEVVTEDSQPGSFRFSVPFDHPYLDKIVGLSSDIRVYDGDEEIFRGRPIDDGEDLYRERVFTLEGELAFLYDSIQPRRELHGISPLEFFRLLIEEHNAQVQGHGPIDKTFKVGIVTVTDPNDSLYRYTNRETTLDDIQDKLLNRLGGHLCVRVEEDGRYLDLLEDVETVSDQPIQLGENLLDYAKDSDYTQIATCCIPLGVALEETEIDALDAYLTVESVNNGSDTIELPSAVERYGRICKVLSFDDITVPANLKAAGERWLQDGQYEQMTLEFVAVDLHALGYDLQPIRKNRKVRCLSAPHGMNRWFEVTQRTYHLTAPDTDTVTFGKTEIQRSFTSSANMKAKDMKDHAEQIRRTIYEVIETEKENVTEILNQATHGYVVLDPNDGPERILIMDTNNVETAEKIWKWDMNGFGYSKNGIEGPWGTAITMDGQFVADYMTTGTLTAAVIRAGILTDVNGTNYWNMETGQFRLAATTLFGSEGTTKTVGNVIDESIDNGIDAYDDSLNQRAVFNKLTNNGVTQGIYLQDNKLYVNASYVKTGTLDADSIELSCSFGGFCKGYGSDGKKQTYGSMMYGRNGKNNAPYIIVTDAGCRMNATGADFYVAGSSIVASDEIQIGSDRRIKKNISYDLEKYKRFFMLLKPCYFRKRTGSSGRFHTGLVAQEVEKALEDAGLTLDDFAGITIEELEEGFEKDGITGRYYQLRYGEFISLCIYMIQNLYSVVSDLAAKANE